VNGDLIGRGRDCDVFDAGPGRVLRRSRSGRSTETEALTMRHVATHGYPVPEVFDADGPDIVMQRIDGRTMLDAMSTRPWSMTTLARMLAELIERLGRVPTPDHDLPVVGGGGDRGADDGAGGALVHLDLHPGNVMLTAAGPVVIDWSNAAVGTAGLDAANTWLTLTAGQPEGSVVMRSAVAVGRRFFVQRFVAAIDRDLAARQLPHAFELRLCDPNQSTAELAAMRSLVERVT
jgi:aminoglycoside phosphotransferase (APT) family kinase protein